MARHLLRASTALASAKPTTRGEPGSNGFWRRDVYSRPGTYTWTAKKDGRVKVQAIGAACGAKGVTAGASGAWGEKTLSVTAGQTLTLVLSPGSAGQIQANTPSAAGTTSISGAPVGGTPLVLLGAAPGVTGTATGPWDVSYPGALPVTTNTGSPSSGSPFGPGFASTDRGGAGWGGGAFGSGGASSHAPGYQKVGAPGLSTRASMLAFATTDESPLADGAIPTRPIWDMADADSAGGSTTTYNTNSGYQRGFNAGPGAGGGYGYAPNSLDAKGGVSVLGGGTAVTGSGVNGISAPKSGFGAGGGCTQSSNGSGGDGGDSIVFVFWDEVA